MASAEGGSVPSGVGHGEGCPLSSQLRGLGERRELPQRGPGQSPGRKRILAYDKIWGGGQFALASPRSKFWGGGLVPPVPPWSTPMGAVPLQVQRRQVHCAHTGSDINSLRHCSSRACAEVTFLSAAGLRSSNFRSAGSERSITNRTQRRPVVNNCRIWIFTSHWKWISAVAVREYTCNC